MRGGTRETAYPSDRRDHPFPVLKGLLAAALLLALPACTADGLGRETAAPSPGSIAAPPGLLPGTVRPDAACTELATACEDGGLAQPGVEWTGAEVCAVGGTGGAAVECRFLGRDQARALDIVLAAARPAPEDTAYCEALSTIYRITFQHPSVRPRPVEVPDRCGPMSRGRTAYLLDEKGRAAARSAFQAGIPSAPAAEPAVKLTREQQAFVESCVGSERALPAPVWIGMKELALVARSDALQAPRRVLGRDGECLGRTDDYQQDRVNLIIDDGTVIWAGRF